MSPRIGILTGTVFLFALGGAEAATKKVTICHYPPGNPDSEHTISVAENAVPAHLRHGDRLGTCPTGCQASGTVCDDGNACTSDVCLANGECEHGPVNCDDGNSCTTDLCDAATGCLTIPAGNATCDDRNDCTTADTCRDRKCEGTPVPGCCAAAEDCDDSDPCTVDACTGNACSNRPRDCALADRCLAGFCDANGECQSAPVSCDDSNVCTDDSCEPSVGCVHLPTDHPPQPTENSCSDGADNDCDGLIDAADPDCPPAPVGCGDSVCTTVLENCGNCPGDCPCTMPGTTCIGGQCHTYCGNGTCEPVVEDNCNCPGDCPPVCGNGTCDCEETCASCPSECGACQICGDGSCDFPEDGCSCSVDCGICVP
jgi:hypothetical protein